MFYWRTTFLILSVVIRISNVECGGAELIVNPPCGPIRGVSVYVAPFKEVYVFYGIPYARPPNKNLRFGPAPASEMKPWTETFNADKLSKPCYQRKTHGFESEVHMTEDCLKLHIWVPKPKPESSTVMVYIHDGGFTTGDPLKVMNRGAALAAAEDVIVVSMNYRLHVQGFISLNTTGAPGNIGLLDQQTALKWLRQNIDSFGGDASDITLFGLGAGGASVGFHMLAQQSSYLFRRAILMSGVPTSPWAFKNIKENMKNSLDFATYLGCKSEDYSKRARCLELIHPDTMLLWRETEYSTEDMALVAPTNDGDFLKDEPKKLIEGTSFSPASIMIGTTADEGSIFMLRDYPELDFRNGHLTTEHFQKMLNRVFKKHSESFRQDIAAMYKKLYTNGTRPDSEDPIVLRDRMKDIFSDYFFNCPSQEFADLYSKDTNNRVYRYVVDHYSWIMGNPEWMGSAHGTDTILHLGIAAPGPPIFTQGASELSVKVMKWWANFARTGNPNAENQNFGQWPTSTKDGQEYLQISVNPEVKKNFRAKECSLLKKLIEKHV